MATLKVPPAGEPESAIEVPAQPETGFAVGVFGELKIVRFNDPGVPVQLAFEPNTETVAVVVGCPGGKTMVTCVVPCPLVMIPPAFTDHV